MGRGSSAQPIDLPDVIRFAWNRDDLDAAAQEEAAAKRREELESYSRIVDDYDPVSFRTEEINEFIWTNRALFNDPGADQEIYPLLERAIEKVITGVFTDSLMDKTPETRMKEFFFKFRATPTKTPFTREIGFDYHLVSKAESDKTICGKQIPYGDGDINSIHEYLNLPCPECSKKVASDKSLSALVNDIASLAEVLPKEWDEARATCVSALKEKILAAKKEDIYNLSKGCHETLENECMKLAARRLMSMSPQARFHTLLSPYRSYNYYDSRGTEIAGVLSLHDSVALSYGEDASAYPWPSEKDLEKFFGLISNSLNSVNEDNREADINFIAAYTVKYLPKAAKKYIGRYRGTETQNNPLFEAIAHYLETNLKEFGKKSKRDKVYY